jgi:hypothetical protein
LLPGSVVSAQRIFCAADFREARENGIASGFAHAASAFAVSEQGNNSRGKPGDILVFDNNARFGADDLEYCTAIDADNGFCARQCLEYCAAGAFGAETEEEGEVEGGVGLRQVGTAVASHFDAIAVGKPFDERAQRFFQFSAPDDYKVCLRDICEDCRDSAEEPVNAAVGTKTSDQAGDSGVSGYAEFGADCRAIKPRAETLGVNAAIDGGKAVAELWECVFDHLATVFGDSDNEVGMSSEEPAVERVASWGLDAVHRAHAEALMREMAKRQRCQPVVVGQMRVDDVDLVFHDEAAQQTQIVDKVHGIQSPIQVKGVYDVHVSFACFALEGPSGGAREPDGMTELLLKACETRHGVGDAGPALA